MAGGPKPAAGANPPPPVHCPRSRSSQEDHPAPVSEQQFAGRLCHPGAGMDGGAFAYSLTMWLVLVSFEPLPGETRTQVLCINECRRKNRTAESRDFHSDRSK